MKTDPFNDRIRQKLESIAPTFRERDWGQFQKQLGQHRPGTFPDAVRHLWQPIAGALVVGALLVGNWWQYQSQQELKKTVQTLTTTVEQLRNATTAPTDTVYVTRYVTTLPSAGQKPGYLTPEQATGGASLLRLNQLDLSEQSADNQLTDAINNDNTKQRLPNAVDAVTGRLTNESYTRDAAGRGASGRNPTRQRRLLLPANTAEPTGQLAITDPNVTSTGQKTGKWNGTAGTTATAVADQLNMASLSPAERRQLKRLLRRTTSRRSAAEQLADSRTSVLTNQTTNRTDRPADEGKANMDALLRANNLLAPARFDSGYYDIDIARQLRRFRSPIATRTSETTATDSPVKTSLAVPTGRFRLGVGGHISYRQLGTGLYAEGLVGTNWTIGSGITVQTLTGQTFLTDEDFDRKTDKDFRREFAPGIDPGHLILNITRRSTVWQIPVSVGYRVSLGQNWLVVPTATFNLNVWNQENVGFSYLRGPKTPPEQRMVSVIYDQRKYHSASFSVNVEKQWALSGKTAFVVQGGPHITVPTLGVSPVSSPNALSGGVRLRTFLQF